MKCVIALLMLFSTVASAANWLYVATNGTPATGNDISYDKASVINDGDTRKVWLKFHGVGTNNAKKSDSKQLWSVRCHERQYRILVLMNNGTDLAPYLNHTYAEIEPDSWMEDLLTQVCAH